MDRAAAKTGSSKRDQSSWNHYTSRHQHHRDSTTDQDQYTPLRSNPFSAMAKPPDSMGYVHSNGHGDDRSESDVPLNRANRQSSIKRTSAPIPPEKARVSNEFSPTGMKRYGDPKMSEAPSSRARSKSRSGSAPQNPVQPPQGGGISFYDAKEQQRSTRSHSAQRPSSAQHDPFETPATHGVNRNFTGPYWASPTKGPIPAKKHWQTEDMTMRLPWTLWMNSTAKNHFVASLGEFVGTTLFLFFAFAGSQVANVGAKENANSTASDKIVKVNPVVLLYVSISFGFSLMVNVWIFFRISGGLFNPAVTLALLVTGTIGKIRAICLFLSQIVASIAASALNEGLFTTRLDVNTTLSDGVSLVKGVFIEAFLTAQLVFAILMLAKEKHRSTFIAPVGIGLALFVGELVGVFYTGGSLNPARTFGPAVITNSWNREHWIYWVGPIIGVLIAVTFYKFIKILEYEMANPGQDADDWNDPTKNPHHELRERQRNWTTRMLQSLGFDHLAWKPNDAEMQTINDPELGYWRQQEHNPNRGHDHVMKVSGDREREVGGGNEQLMEDGSNANIHTGRSFA
ncbi:MAG: hypothetical protein M1820_006166 [Bogoriella megaspora]|nr:MAG: hypothetical protein M1820_006166 [Bogoriella megaspora]